MPNAKVLAQKQEVVSQLVETMKGASAGVLVDYKGISVEQDTKLRANLRTNNIEYAVIKNTLARLAIREVGFDELDDVLHGTTAMAVSMDDSILPARLIAEFAKKNPKIFKIKAGFVDGQVVDAETVVQLGELISKQALLAQVLGTLQAPIAAFARTIDAIAEKMGKPAEEAAESPAEENAEAAAEATPEAAPEAAPEAPAE